MKTGITNKFTTGHFSARLNFDIPQGTPVEYGARDCDGNPFPHWSRYFLTCNLKIRKGIKQMNCQFINNGRLFDCVALSAINNNGFKEIAICISGKSKSVLYSVGTHHWVLPSTLAPLGKSKQKKTGVETKISAVDQMAFIKALPKFNGEK